MSSHKDVIATVERLEAALRAKHTAPEGWNKISDIAKHVGRPKATVRDLICRGVEDGLWEEKIFEVKTGSGVRSIRHYREVPS